MLHKNIRVGESPIAGLGLFAVRPIAKGETVWTGPTQEATFSAAVVARWSVSKRKSFFFYAYQTAGDQWTGPESGRPSDHSLYMNHSCEPNSWFTGDLRLEACRDIKAGEEVTYDYETSESVSLQSDPMICNCHAALCRSLLDGRAFQTPAFQNRYRKHMLNYLERAATTKEDGSERTVLNPEATCPTKEIGTERPGAGNI